MSISGSIAVKFYEQEGYSAIGCIRLLLDNGWRFGNDAGLSYLPLGDGDNYDWQEMRDNDPKIWDVLAEKEKCDEQIGIWMTWGDTGIGGNFIFGEDLEFFVILAHHVLGSSRFTDFSWFTSRLLPALDSKWQIESYSCSEN